MRTSVKLYATAILSLSVAAACIWYAVWREDRRELVVRFLDVGQGDAIFIESPSGAQALIDGGRGASVVRSLSRAMPWYDRSIDVVVATHPDADHIGGLIPVLERFAIARVVHSSVEGDTALSEALEQAVAHEGAERSNAMRGQVVDLGGGAIVEILFPDRDVSGVETNTGSIVARLVYGNTAFLLTGDAPQGVEKYLARLDPDSVRADVLKAGHHGSKTSSAPLFVGLAGPKYAVFSRGCENSYGHPAPEVVALFERFGIPALDTCIEGTITFVSDGHSVARK